MEYYFNSVGQRGVINKVVRFERRSIDMPVYNLAFGDIDPITNKPDDLVKSNNGDRDLIMATLGAIVLDFMKDNPDCIVRAEGSTFARTRLYQMAIASNLAEISLIFDVFGYVDGEWHRFIRGNNYKQFFVKRLET